MDWFLIFKITLCIIGIILYLVVIIIALFNRYSLSKRGKLKEYWEIIKSEEIELSKFVFAFTLFIIFNVFLFFGLGLAAKDIGEGLFIELMGMLFDVIVLVLLFNWIRALGEKKRYIQQLRDEIEDFSHWNSEEAKYRIRGNLFRLNKEGTTVEKFGSQDVSKYLDFRGIQVRNLNMEDVTFFKVDFSGCDFDTPIFDNCVATNLRFNSILNINERDGLEKKRKSLLLRSQFKNAHLQDCWFHEAYLHAADFTNAILVGVDFSEADLRHTVFKEANLSGINFHGAKVNEDFFKKIKEWEIKGQKIDEEYDLITIPLRRFQGKFEYVLNKK